MHRKPALKCSSWKIHIWPLTSQNWVRLATWLAAFPQKQPSWSPHCTGPHSRERDKGTRVKLQDWPEQRLKGLTEPSYWDTVTGTVMVYSPHCQASQPPTLLCPDCSLKTAPTHTTSSKTVTQTPLLLNPCNTHLLLNPWHTHTHLSLPYKHHFCLITHRHTHTHPHTLLHLIVTQNCCYLMQHTHTHHPSLSTAQASAYY